MVGRSQLRTGLHFVLHLSQVMMAQWVYALFLVVASSTGDSPQVQPCRKVKFTDSYLAVAVQVSSQAFYLFVSGRSGCYSHACVCTGNTSHVVANSITERSDNRFRLSVSLTNENENIRISVFIKRLCELVTFVAQNFSK